MGFANDKSGSDVFQLGSLLAAKILQYYVLDFQDDPDARKAFQRIEHGGSYHIEVCKIGWNICPEFGRQFFGQRDVVVNIDGTCYSGKIEETIGTDLLLPQNDSLGERTPIATHQKIIIQQVIPHSKIKQ